MNKSGQQTSFFNNLAASWDEKCTHPSSDRLDSIVDLANLGNGNFFVLDVGCGTGALIPSLLKVIGDDGRIIAIDPAKEMLSELQRKHPDRRIQARCEALEDCLIEKSSLDAVFCFSVFPHIDDKQKALLNSARMLKPNGLLVIAHINSRDEINAFHKSCSAPVRNDYLPDKTEMTALLLKAGFMVELFIDKSGCYELVARNGA